MKKILTIVQWVVSGMFALCLFATGFHWTGLLVLAATLLMMPLAVVRDVLAKGKIKRWMAITASVVLFFTALCLSPSSSSPQSDTLGENATAATMSTTVTSTSKTTRTTTTKRPTTLTTTKPTTTTTTGSIQQQAAYVLNTNTKKIHLPSCRYVKDIKPANRQSYRGNCHELTAQGYSFCKVCF